MYTIDKPLHLSPYDHPDIYPGPTPKKSYLYMNGSVYFLQGNKDFSNLSVMINHKRVKLNDILRTYGAASIEERYPILSYASNACLAQLKYKYQLNPKVCSLTINLRGSILDTDVIYSSIITRYGAIPATLSPMKGAKCQVWLSLLDEKQLQHMIQTEKPYSLMASNSKKLYLENGLKPSLYYAFLYDQAFTLGETFFRYPDIPATGTMARRIWQAHMLEFISTFFRMDRDQFISTIKKDEHFRGKVQIVLHRLSKPMKWEDWQKVEKIQNWKENQKNGHF